MNLDRDLQRRHLDRLAEAYPAYLDGFDASDLHLQANLAYLREHELIDGKGLFTMGANAILAAKITAKGLDFLADDGGLGSILGTVRVKLDAESIEALIARKIEASDLETEQKRTLIQKMRGYAGGKMEDGCRRYEADRVGS